MLDDELLDRLQRGAFGYFVDQTNPVNGLVADTSRAGSPASIAVVGFALSSYPAAVERGCTRANLALGNGDRGSQCASFLFSSGASVHD